MERTMNEEERREAICKRCGVIWHPWNTETRRPTRCPYCHSRRTEWLDQHPELLESVANQVKKDNSNTELSKFVIAVEINSNSLILTISSNGTNYEQKPRGDV